MILRRRPWKTEQAVERAFWNGCPGSAHHSFMGRWDTCRRPSSKPITIGNALVRPRPPDQKEAASVDAEAIIIAIE